MIYFAQCGNDGPIKIGHTSSSLRSRITYLQVGCPWPIRVLGTMNGDETDEGRLLGKFSHIRMRGEWFRPEADLVAFVAANASPPSYPVSAIGTDVISDILRERGWTQTRLAQELGVDQGTISIWQNKGIPKRGAARALIEHFCSREAA